MSDSNNPACLTLITRENCALCDHVVLALELMQHRREFRYESIDVDGDEELVGRHGIRVPVLLHGDEEICAGHCDPAAIEAYLAAL